SSNVYWLMDRWTESVELARAAERQPVRSAYGSAAVLLILAQADVRVGRYAEALRYQWRALMVAMDARDLVRVGNSLMELATTKHLAGIAGVASTRRQLHASLRLFLRERDRSGEAEARHELANLL